MLMLVQITARDAAKPAYGGESGGGGPGQLGSLPARWKLQCFSDSPFASMVASWAWESTHSADWRAAKHGFSSSLPDMAVTVSAAPAECDQTCFGGLAITPQAAGQRSAASGAPRWGILINLRSAVQL